MNALDERIKAIGQVHSKTRKGPGRADYNEIVEGLAGVAAEVGPLIEQERAVRDQYRPGAAEP